MLLHGRCHVGSLRRQRSHIWEMLGLTLFSLGEKIVENQQKFYVMKTSAKIISLFIVLLGFVAPSRVEATITKDQAVQYVQNTWGIVDLSSDVISKTLDTSFSGVPYTDWIDFLVNAPSIYQPLSTGDYSTAAKNAYSYGTGAAFSELISECGLTGVAAPAELAAWPIQISLDAFYTAVADASFKKQCQFYFAARSAGNTMDYIINAPDDTLIDADTTMVQGGLLTKYGGWLYIYTSYHDGAPPGFTPVQFFEYAEKLWQANQAASSFNAASSQLAQNFRDAALYPPVAPTITIPPSSVTVSVGDVATFTVTACGTGPLYYQWQKNGVDIANARSWYYITPAAQSSNNGDQYRVRVTNAQGNPTSSAATLTVSGVSSGTAPVITTVSPSTLTGLPTGQTQLIRIIGSGFTGSSTLTFNDGVTPYTGRVPSSWSANELDYNISVGTNQASWSVVVVNGAQTSNMKYFTVNAPSAAPTGSLVVNLSPSGATSAGAQWLLNGSYHNSGDVVTALTPGQYTVSFKSISGYTTPASQIVTTTASTQTTANATYSTIAPSTYTLTLNYNNAQGGASASPSASGNIYNAGAVVQLYASASTGYHFTGWNGDASGTANPTPLTINGNKNVTANFASGDPNLGTVSVTILPPAAAAAGVTWGFNANDYRASGTSYTTWPATYILNLHMVDGWLGQFNLLATISAEQTTNYTVTFTADTTPGLLTVTLSPPDAVTAGAKWHVNGGASQGNGASLSLLPSTNYTVTFDSVSGWTAPPSQTVTVQRSQTTTATGKYTPPIGQPSIASVQPTVGALTGGTQLTIQGYNFTAPATVMIAGLPASNVTVVSGSQITCFTPSNSTYGSAPVVIQTSSGNATNLNGFAYGFPRGNGIQLVGSIGGFIKAMAAQGNYGYSGEGNTFIVFDVSNPTSPTPVSRLALPGLVQDVALFSSSGQLFAAVADDDGGLQIVNVTSPASPSLRGYYNTGDQALGVAVVGTNAYVGNGSSGFMVFDLSNPTRPRLMSSLATGYTDRLSLVANNTTTLAYLSAGGGLSIVDASNPNTPTLRGQTSSFNTWWENHSITVIGSRAFVADSYGYLQAVDITNPDSPLALGAISSDAPSAVTSVGGKIYTWSSGGMQIYNYPGGQVQRIGYLPTSSGAFQGNSFAIVGGIAICTGGENGFQVFDVSTPSNPIYRGMYSSTAGYYLCSDINGNNAFLSTQNSGLKVFDMSNPASPILESVLSGAGGSKVVISGNRGYTTGKIIDISNPASPQILGTISQSLLFLIDFYISGNLIVSAGSDSTYVPSLIMLNAANPSSLSIQGQLRFSNTNGSPASLVVGNNSLACVTVPFPSGQDYSLRLINITSPTSPQQIGLLPDIGGIVRCMRLSQDSRYLFIGCYEMNWKIVDLLNNSSPVLVSSNSVDSTVNGIDISGTTAFIAEGKHLQIYDVSNPAQPRLLRSYLLPRLASGVKVVGSLVYVADSDAGFTILKLSDIDSPEIFIATPTSASTYTNTDGSLTLSGTADDNLGLAQSGISGVTWANNRGGGGVATGTTNWSVSSITLLPGTNIISIAATDVTGNSSNVTLTVIYQSPKQSQTITFPTIADHTFGDPTIPLVAAASSGLPVAFSVISGPATLTSSNTMTLTGAGTVTVQASQAGDSSYNPAASTNLAFSVSKANQSISFTLIPAKSAGDVPFTPIASTSSGLPAYFNIISGPAVLDTNNLVTLIGSGVLTIAAWQPGNLNYNAAVAMQQSVNVGKIPQSIAFGAMSQQKIGDAPFPLLAISDSGLPVSFSVSGPATLSGNIVTLTGHGTVTVTALQSGNNSYAAATPVVQSFIVAPPDNTLIALGFQNRSFQMALYGIVGSNYTVQASSNLLNWQPFTNFTITNSPYSFIDPATTNFNRRFYRATP